MVDLTHVRAQVVQYSRADQAGVQATMRAVVRANPADPQAWLCLSACVPSLSQRRDCLEQALRLDPRSPAIHAELQLVREQELQAMQQRLRGCRSIVPAPAGPPILRLGEYLQSQGVSPEHIQRALMLQRAAPLTNRKPLLGEILVAQGWSTPERVAELLIRQASSRVVNQGSGQPDPIGEYLLRRGHISLGQLQSAVTAQLRAIQSGKYIRIGEVLVGEQAISATQLARALREQEQMYGQLYY